MRPPQRRNFTHIYNELQLATSLFCENCFAVYFSICFSSHSLPCPTLQKYVISDDFFILRGHMKRFPVSDNNLFCNCWSKRNSYGLLMRQHHYPNLKAWSHPQVQTSLLCTWCQEALHCSFLHNIYFSFAGILFHFWKWDIYMSFKWMTCVIYLKWCFS